MGVVEEVEKRRRQGGQNLFIRVKVAIPIVKPVRRGDLWLAQMAKRCGP